ncbi:MAG: putative monovalent cation/H+ antiporter subunit A [Chthoniobacterales bacterium]
MEIGLPISILAVFLAGLVAPAAHRRFGDNVGLVLALVPLGAFAYFTTLVPAVMEGNAHRLVIPWVPSLDLALSFYVDGLSLLFLLIVSLIGTFVVWYATGYLHGDPDLGRFFLYLLSFMAAMLGLVAADNLILLVVFWELTSITSYLLIGYYASKSESRAAALQALLVTGLGGLALMAGLILLGRIAGTFEISEILALGPAPIIESPLFPATLILILLGAFTKSAQFPFHFWLPNAMAAPAPVSSFLHSATMVKAGVFLLARLHPVLDDHALWLAIVAPVGAMTMILGVLLGLGQRDLKKILAYSTLAVLGTLVMLLGLGTELAIKACLIYLLAHALYKAALFMAAGAVDHETGTRDVEILGGLHRSMPFTATAALIGALSMAGVPVFVGFVSKEYFYKALLDADGPPYLWEILGVSASICMFALAIITGIRPFWGQPRGETPKKPHEAPWTMWIGPIVLGLAAIKFGILPAWPGDILVGPAVRDVAATAYAPKFELWHGFTTALLLSGVTVVGGIALLFIAGRFRAATSIYSAFAAVGPERLYAFLLRSLATVSAAQTRFLQSGYLRNYLLTIGTFTALLLLIRLPFTPFEIDLSTMVTPSVLGLVTCGLIIAAAIFTCLAENRFTAIVNLGVVGLGIAMLFFIYSAPDLAMTQILVETLTVVLFVLAFLRLPRMAHLSSPRTRAIDAVLALGFGALMSILVLIGFQFEVSAEPISRFMGEQSYPAGYGRNVVNVILVDFRALDTFGEIIVLAIAALGIFAMLRLGTRKEEDAP